MLAKLEGRVEYFINYKLKDLNDSGIVVFFVRAFYSDSQFYMIMAAPDAQNDPKRHRAYRLDNRDPSGRDKFKLVSAEEFRRISEQVKAGPSLCQNQSSPKIIARRT